MSDDRTAHSLDTAQFLPAFVELAARSGIETSENELRRAYALVDGQVSSDTMAGMARELGLHIRPIHLEWDELPQLRSALPAIVQLRDGSYLIAEGVLEDTPHGRILIARDPGAHSEEGDIALDRQRFERLCTGDFVLVKRQYHLSDTHQPFSLRWIVSQMLLERSVLRDIAIASVIITFFSLLPPVLTIIVMDRVLVNHSYSTLAVMCGAVGVLIIFEMITGYCRRLFMEVMATRIDGRLSLYLLDRLLGLPIDFFERNPTGLLQAKLSKIYQIRTFLTGKLLQTVLDFIIVLVVVPILFYLNWALTLMILALATGLALIVYFYADVVGRKFKDVVSAEQRKNTHLVESIYGMRTIKSLALEGRRRAEWDMHVAQSVSARHELGQTTNIPQTLSVPFEKLIFAGIFLMGAYLTLIDPSTFQPGSLMAFIMLGGRATQPIIQLAQLIQDWGEIKEAVNEVASVVNAPPELTRIGTGLRQPISGHISFSDVSFAYSPGAPLALANATFDIPTGAIFGIMGRSGSGKTTITRLLQGLNTHYEGIVKIDGMDLREIDLQHLRTRIGIVAQENFLFSGTIRENIGIAKPNATLAEIVRVAQLAGAEEFIERLPKGYDTHLSEGASNLSGGQRQRLAIARALILDPPILILDEATSALDAESEAIINANLMRIAQGRSIICVSHRLAMLVNADNIMVMDKGRVDDIGSHLELLHRNEIYKHMWYTQNRPNEVNPSAKLTITHHQ